MDEGVYVETVLGIGTVAAMKALEMRVEQTGKNTNETRGLQYVPISMLVREESLAFARS